MIVFQEEGHLYTSVIPDGVKWLGVTTLIKKLHEPFGAGGVDMAFACSTRKPSKLYPNKWYGIPPSEIDAIWEAERNRSTELGSWYHKKREDALFSTENEFDVHCPRFEGGKKFAPDQSLTEGIYPELLVYILSSEICGQADYVEVVKGIVNIKDYKTSKEIRRKGFTNYKGTKMMYPPIEHLEDCEYTHYNIQLSLYMYMILRHNPNYEPGTLTIEHVKFEETGRDKYDYPIYKKDEAGEFIIKEIEEIKMPYLKKEVISILDWLKENKQNIIAQ